MAALGQTLNGAFTARQVQALRLLLLDNKAVILALAAKLDADATVTDTNYAATINALATMTKD